MHSSHSSKLLSSKTKHWLIWTLTWICRLVTGCTFIVSGFVKAVDVWGSLYKFEEYLAAMGIHMLHSLLLAGVFALCILEFLIGVSLLLGCYRKSMPRIATAFMAIMLGITLWIAIADPVSDCGCFGDFIILSNWATFWKNVVLIALCLWLIKFNTRCVSIISPAFQWVGFVATIIMVASIELIGYMRQPILDFRSYPVGSNLVELTESENDSDEATDSESDDDDDQDSENDEATSYLFVYEKDGVKKEFSIDDELPDEADGWKFVERKDIFDSNSKNKKDDSARAPVEKGANEKNFRLWDRKGEADLTHEAISAKEKEIVMLMPELKNVSPATTWKINAIYDWAQEHGVKMVAVVNANPNEIEEWEDLSMPQYPIYTADDVAIKEVARGNPALVYLENNVVVWKSTLDAIDDDSISGDNKIDDFKSLATNDIPLLKQILIAYLISLAILVAISYIPRIYQLFNRNKNNDHEDRED